MDAPQPKSKNSTIHLNIPSTILLLLGILSSSYLAYRDGQRASNFITKLSSHMKRVHHPPLPPTQQPTQPIAEDLRPFIGSLGSEGNKGQFPPHNVAYAEDGNSSSSNHSSDEGKTLSEQQEMAPSLSLPSGQHLFIDIQNVNTNFLTSEIQLSNAMKTFVHKALLPLLSYHCHELPSYSSKITKTTNDIMGGMEEESNGGAGRGKTCAAILLHGHMTLHTWPNDNVIVLDLFTPQQQSEDIDLIPLIPLLEQQFAVPTIDTNNSMSEHYNVSNKPKLHWGHKLRGFRSINPSYQQDKNPYDQELGEDVLRRRSFDMKRSIVSTKTKYQSVDIYELQHDKDGTTYAALGRGRDTVMKRGKQDGDLMLSVDVEQSVAPDRVLFIDGVLQSSFYGEAAYHESLVHPALLSHSDPKRVAIM